MCELLVLFFAALCGVFFALWRRAAMQSEILSGALSVIHAVITSNITPEQFNGWMRNYERKLKERMQ